MEILAFNMTLLLAIAFTQGRRVVHKTCLYGANNNQAMMNSWLEDIPEAHRQANSHEGVFFNY